MKDQPSPRRGARPPHPSRVAHARPRQPLSQHEIARDLLSREIGYVRKPHDGKLRIALSFPNTYFVGMSNLGFQTIYRLFNEHSDIVCERVFLPAKQELQALLTSGARIVTILPDSGERYISAPFFAPNGA